jgi:hypothetical protein
MISRYYVVKGTGIFSGMLDGLIQTTSSGILQSYRSLSEY